MFIMDLAYLLMVNKIVPDTAESQVQFIFGTYLTETKNLHLNVFIYKETFGNKEFENKKLTLLGVV